MRTTGVLLAQLGTPDAPTTAAVRRYLREFLSDRRVIETNPVLWQLILHLVVLPFRSRASAAKYRRIWSAQHGSPLLRWTARQGELAQHSLGDDFVVAVGMRYGRPSIAAALDRLMAADCHRVVVLPLYPQYAASSTGTAYDALFAALRARRYVPAIQVVPPYFDDGGYIKAVVSRIRETLAGEAPPDHILLSFHALPVAMIEKGDPYRDHCEITARLVASALGLEAGAWTLTYQSRFGGAEWLAPQTEPTLVGLARAGKRRVLVATPGFTADCLETLDEIGFEARAAFHEAGGEELLLVPCLDDHPVWIDALVNLVRAAAPR